MIIDLKVVYLKNAYYLRASYKVDYNLLFKGNRRVTVLPCPT